MLLGEVFGQDTLILLLVVVVVFGASRLPKMARSIGQAKGEFEKGLKDNEATNDKTQA